MGKRGGPREHGIVIGRLPPGPTNTLTDVPGVRVGHVTVVEPTLGTAPGEGPVRTGVTAILPHEGNVYRTKVRAAVHVFNGTGECTGALQIEEWGLLESPIVLTNTVSVGHGLLGCHRFMMEQTPDIGVTVVPALPVVAECNDMYLNDVRRPALTSEHVVLALRHAQPFTQQGAVGAGTGMVAYAFKGGVGSASRRVEISGRPYTLGVLVLVNCGRRKELTVAGVPVGPRLAHLPGPPYAVGEGSLVGIIATDVPLPSQQLRRLARRAPLGMARTGTVGHPGSGDVFLAFSTTARVEHGQQEEPWAPGEVRPDRLPVLFQAVEEAVEEAIVSALFWADYTTGPDGREVLPLPVDEVVRLVREATR